jgi:hypothetical protein
VWPVGLVGLTSSYMLQNGSSGYFGADWINLHERCKRMSSVSCIGADNEREIVCYRQSTTFKWCLPSVSTTADHQLHDASERYIFNSFDYLNYLLQLRTDSRG